MPRKKAATKKTKATKTTRKVKTQKVKRAPIAESRKRSALASFVDQIRLGESYASLVLGIVAVIVGTVLLLSIIHARQESSVATPEVTPTIAQSESFAISPTGVKIEQPQATSMPSAQPTVTPVKQMQAGKPTPGKTYIVAAGDNLWVIAEKVYGSGYNWVDIAKANNLAEPGDIHVGDKLVTPKIVTALKDATVHTADDNMSTSVQPSIIVSSYTVQPGDTLWSIAVRAYGDGYQWVKIAQANNLSNPDVIHKDNVLKIPRN